MESITSYHDICKLARLLSFHNVPYDILKDTINCILGASWYELYDDLSYLFMIEIVSHVHIHLYHKLVTLEDWCIDDALHNVCIGLKSILNHETFYQYLMIIKYYMNNDFRKLKSSYIHTEVHYTTIICGLSCDLYDYYDHLVYTEYDSANKIVYRFDSINEWPKLSIGDRVCCDYDTFLDRFREFTQGIFDDIPDLPIDNMLFAGGAINKLLRINYEPALAVTSDIDIFIVNDIQGPDDIAKHIISSLARKYNNDVYYYRNNCVYNVFVYGLKRCIQIVYDKGCHPAMILDNFDFMHSKVGFINGRIICDPMYMVTLITMHTWTDSNADKISLYRLYKSYVEGYTFDSQSSVMNGRYILTSMECQEYKKIRYSRMYPGYIETDDIIYSLSCIYDVDICTIHDDFNNRYNGHIVYDLADIDVLSIVVDIGDDYKYITINGESITYFKTRCVSKAEIIGFVKGYLYYMHQILNPFSHLLSGYDLEIHDNHTILTNSDSEDYYPSNIHAYSEIVYAIKIATISLPAIIEVVRIY